MLPILPGVTWLSSNRDALKVNRRIAGLFTKQFFHLMGYRNKQFGKTHLIVKNREVASKNEAYTNTIWNKNNVTYNFNEHLNQLFFRALKKKELIPFPCKII